MANQVAARLSGDDYQHLTSWLHVLELKRPRKQVHSVSVEDERAGSADDVTVRHEPGSSHRDRFYQIKYHVDQRSGYSTGSLTHVEGNATSLLQKLFATWKKLLAESNGRPFEIHFVSNWSWDASDKVGECFSGLNNKVKESFFEAGAKSDIGKIRDGWRGHVNATEEDFSEFVRTLHFDLGATCFDERLERVRDQMEHLGYKCDDASLLVAVGIVRTWIQRGVQVVTQELLDQVIEAHELQAPPETDKCVTVLLTTVKKQRIDIVPDHIIDWREKFEGPDYEKGHTTLPGIDWNTDLMPELFALEAQIAEETGCRLVRARGLARLSAWFGFGRAFSENARYLLEVDQRGLLWRTDAEPSPDFKLIATNGSGEQFDGDAETLAIGISVTSEIDSAVREHLSAAHSASRLVLLAPNRPLGHACITSAGDAVALAREAKSIVRRLVADHQAKTVLLFYLGPLSGACFIGHLFNSMGAGVRVMEFQDPGYSPAVLLS